MAAEKEKSLQSCIKGRPDTALSIMNLLSGQLSNRNCEGGK